MGGDKEEKEEGRVGLLVFSCFGYYLFPETDNFIFIIVIYVLLHAHTVLLFEAFKGHVCH